MITWLITLLLALFFRTWAKTNERKQAGLLTAYTYEGNKTEVVALMNKLTFRPTASNLLRKEIFSSFAPFSTVIALLYSLFAFSLAIVDVRTPHAMSLWDNEAQFYALHDPDLYEIYRSWRTAFFWDGVSAGMLLLVLLSVCSRTVYTMLYR